MTNTNDKDANIDSDKNVRVDSKCYLLLKRMKAEKRAKGIRMSAGAIVGELVNKATED